MPTSTTPPISINTSNPKPSNKYRNSNPDRHMIRNVLHVYCERHPAAWRAWSERSTARPCCFICCMQECGRTVRHVVYLPACGINRRSRSLQLANQSTPEIKIHISSQLREAMIRYVGVKGHVVYRTLTRSFPNQRVKRISEILICWYRF